MFRSRLSLSIALFFLLFASANAELFRIGRVHYGGGGDWYSDPSSLPNLLQFASDALGIETAVSEDDVSLADENLFSFPYLYLTGHGNISFTEEESTRLRDYLYGGGFLHVDDNYGLNDSFKRELAKIFPNKKLIEVPFKHPVYHSCFQFPEGLPKIHEHDGLPPQGSGIFLDGRLVLFYTYQCDLGDGWEDQKIHNVPENLRTSALKMGTNIIAYVLSGMQKFVNK